MTNLRAHLLTTRKRAVVLPDGSRALSEGDAPAGPRPAGSTKAGSRQGTGFALPTAPLTAPSFGALWWPRGAKPLSFKMCAFQGKKTLTNRLLVLDAVGLSVRPVILAKTAVQGSDLILV